MDRDDLAHLLTDTSYASAACRHALLDGANFILWTGSNAADRMLPAYERRGARAVATGVPTLGLTEALDGLRRAGTDPIQLGQVNVASPPYTFMIFLSGEPMSVIACFGVAGGVE